MNIIEAVAEAKRTGKGFRRGLGGLVFHIDECGNMANGSLTFEGNAHLILATDWEMVARKEKQDG